MNRSPRKRGLLFCGSFLIDRSATVRPTLALTVTLTYALAVSAIRKGNAAPKTWRISYISASHVRALQRRD